VAGAEGVLCGSEVQRIVGFADDICEESGQRVAISRGFWGQGLGLQAYRQSDQAAGRESHLFLDLFQSSRDSAGRVTEKLGRTGRWYNIHAPDLAVVTSCLR